MKTLKSTFSSIIFLMSFSNLFSQTEISVDSVFVHNLEEFKSFVDSEKYDSRYYTTLELFQEIKMNVVNRCSIEGQMNKFGYEYEFYYCTDKYYDLIGNKRIGFLLYENFNIMIITK